MEKELEITLAKYIIFHLEYDGEYGLYPFYLLFHDWWELDDLGFNFYWPEATKSNINSIVQKEARQ